MDTECQILNPRKPHGYWTRENTILEAQLLIDKYGEDCIKSTWLLHNGFYPLANAISRNGGYCKIREELRIEGVGSRANGHWGKTGTILEAKKILVEHGKDCLAQGWLITNGHSSLNKAIIANGGYRRIREELGIAGEDDRRPNGYWTKENTISEFKKLFEKYGEKCINNTWLKENQYARHGAAMLAHGGIDWICEEFKIERKKKPKGHWKNRDNVILEAKMLVEKYGEDCLTQSWLQLNDYGGLANAISRNGGFCEIREELAVKHPINNPYSTTRIKQRSVNLDRLRLIISDLCLEGVEGFTPAQLVVVLQQAGFNNLPYDEGKDLYLALTTGLLLPQELITWSKGDKSEPCVLAGEPELKGEPVILTSTPEDVELEMARNFGECEEDDSAHFDQKRDSQPDETSQLLPPLALMDPSDQLRFLDAEIFASADDEAIEALISMGLHQLWAKAYLGADQATQVATACHQFHPKRPWSKRLQQLFLKQYSAAAGLELPKGFNYRVDGQLVEPRLMQRHVASIALERRRLLVMSDMGTGKSLAAQLAVMADGAQRLLVVAINSCVNQWVYDFRYRWEGNTVKLLDLAAIRSSADGDRPVTPSGKRAIWIIPSHLLSLMKDEEIAGVVDALRPEGVILDEIHVFKQREGADESQRRQQTIKLLTTASELSPQLMVLGLSGTVITNSLSEGRTLLELVMGEERQDLPTGRGIAKAMRMHQALMANGIRQRGDNNFPFVVERPEVDASDLVEDVQLALQHPPRLRPFQVEKVLIHARLPAVVAAIDGPTVVVTQYVQGFIKPLRAALERAGHRVGVHTGEEKFPVSGHTNAVEAFKAGDLDVLLASISTVSTGVDGLQSVSSNLVIASMPWTASDYLQLIARLARYGQDKTVRVVIPTTYINYIDEEIGPAHWSFCSYRAGIIACKQRLMDAVMDGLVPESEEITEAKAGQQLVKWLERLNSKGALVRPCRPIRVPLVFDTEEEETKARARFGSWSSCNGRWNSQSSDKLHKRLQANPEEWELYHTELDSLRKEWDVDPLEEAINHCMKSQGLVIGDFGCGTARLADEMQDRHIVHSFDHIAINDKVIACDIASGVPLPDASLDLAIFSLSLMGPNWKEQLVEARRCLKPTGQVLIWTAASGKDAAEFSSAVESAGFKVVTSQAHYKWIHVWAVCI
jgi:hypothetical protein